MIRRHVTMESRRSCWARHVARIGKRRGVYRVVAVKPEGRRPLGRLRLRWEDNIKMDLRVRDGGMDWINLAQMAGSCNEPSGSIK